MATFDDLVVNEQVVIPGDELTVATSRASGPGGQHVNTTESRVQLRWNPATSRALNESQRARVLRVLATRLTTDDELVVACAAERSQHQNRELARARLAEMVRQALIPPKPRRKTRLPRAVKERRLRDKKRRSDRKRQRRIRDDD